MGQNGDAPSWHKDLRTALRYLWDPDRLSRSPLAELEAVRRRAARREGDLPASLDLAQALRQALTEALESLRPPGSPQPRDRRWQRYRLLHDTYWQGHDNETVMRRLYLSRTTFYREQRRAIAALAQALTDLSAPAPAAASGPASGEPIPTTRDFVGRVAELAHYDALLNQHRWAVIEGPPGVGKTALGAALARQRMHEEQVFWHTFRPGLNDDVTSVVQALALFLAQQGNAGLVAPSADAHPLGPTVARLLAGLHGRAVLLCFDDAHVVDDDPAVRSLLQTLFQSACEGRLALLVLSRHRPAFTTEPTGPALGGLSPADTTALLQQLNLPTLPPDLFAALCQRTQGNPQLLRLFAAGLSARELGPAAFAASCRKAVAAMPRQRAVYAYLMDNVWLVLSPQEQETLQALTVCRPPVRYETAEALLDRPGQDARAVLYGLVDHHILEETPDGTALIVSPLVCAFCYDLFAGRDATRTRLHHRAATVYEDEGKVLEAAHHYVAAGELSLAARLLVAHVDALLEAGQSGLLARQLAEFPSGLEPEHLPLDDWVAVRIALGRAQAQQGDYDGAVATYDLLLAALQAQEEAVARRHRALVYYWLAAVYEEQGDYDTALAFLQRGIAQAEALEGEPRMLGQLLARIAGVLYRRAEYDQALGYCERSLALLPPEGQDDVVGEVYRTMGAIHHARGELTPAIAYAETALWASRRADDVAGQVRAHQHLADYYAQRRDYAAGEHAMQVRLLRKRPPAPNTGGVTGRRFPLPPSPQLGGIEGGGG